MPPTEPSANHLNASKTGDEAIISCFRSDPNADNQLLERLNIEQMFVLIDGVLPIEACLYYQVLPLFLDGSRLNLGMVCPDDISAADYVRRIVSYLNYSLFTRQISSETLQVSLSAYLRYADRKSALVSSVEPTPASRRAKRLSGLDRASRRVDAASQPTLVVDSPDSLDTSVDSPDLHSSPGRKVTDSDETAVTVQLENDEADLAEQDFHGRSSHLNEEAATQTVLDDSHHNFDEDEHLSESESLLEESLLSEVIEADDLAEAYFLSRQDDEYVSNDLPADLLDDWGEDADDSESDLAANEALGALEPPDPATALDERLTQDGTGNLLEAWVEEEQIEEDQVNTPLSSDDALHPIQEASEADNDPLKLEIPPIPLDAVEDTLIHEFEDSTDNSSHGQWLPDAGVEADAEVPFTDAPFTSDGEGLDDRSSETLPPDMDQPLLNLDLDESLIELSLENISELPPAALVRSLLTRVLQSGIGRLYFEHRHVSGRILWSESGVLQSVIDEIPTAVFLRIIEELKRLTQRPLDAVEKAYQVDLERIYQDERILLRFRFIQTEYGEDATLQVLRGAALRFYQQQQLSKLERDALSIATALQQKVKEIGDRTRTLRGFSSHQAEVLPTLTQLLAQIEAELSEIQQATQRD